MTLLPFANAPSSGLTAIANNNLLANTSGSSAKPVATTLSTLVSAVSGGGTANFLRADGSWQPPILPVVAVTGATKTLALTDAYTIQDCSNSAQQTITIPTNASVAFAVNTFIQFEQNGVGNLLIVGTTGVTVNGVSAGSASTTSQYSVLYIRQESANTWYVEGASSTTQQTLSGSTAGSIVYSMPNQATNYKKFVAHAFSYENNTVTNQTISFPVAFTNTPSISVNSTNLTLSVSASTLTITSPDNTSTFSGNIIIEGY